MLLPKRVKYRRVQRGRMTGKAMRGNTVTYGEFGLVATEPAWITSNQIEAARIAMTRYTKRGGQVWIKIFPDKPVTQKPAETRMGSGKGSPEYWVAVVKPGRVMFEIAGVPEDVAREALRLASHKLPIKTKVTELINAVGSDAPAPGGGAVAGLAGGIGVALTMMVNGLTLSKKGFEDDRERILDAIAKGNELKERFVDVMNRDSEVFDVLIESLALPKENDAQKAIRRGAVQASFRNCTEVPLTMMEVCLESIDLLATLVGTTNPNVVSDLGIAALTLKTAMQSAWLNVLINLSSLKDKEYADECCHKGEAMLAHAIPLAEECYEKVLKVIEKK